MTIELAPSQLVAIRKDGRFIAAVTEWPGGTRQRSPWFREDGVFGRQLRRDPTNYLWTGEKGRVLYIVTCQLHPRKP